MDQELDGLLNADQHRSLYTIIRGAQRLSAMADDLLDLARLEC